MVAGVLDTDFIAAWDKMSPRLEGKVTLIENGPALNQVGIRSLAGFKRGPIGPGGHMYPSPEYFMEKMLERWGFIRYDSGSGVFNKGLTYPLSPDVVMQNGFPNIYRDVNTDFTRPANPREDETLLTFHYGSPKWIDGTIATPGSVKVVAYEFLVRARKAGVNNRRIPYDGCGNLVHILTVADGRGMLPRSLLACAA